MNFTDTYLNDRQALLQYVITANLKDAVANPDGYLAVQGATNANINTRFIDLTSGTMLQVNHALISPSTAPNQYILFGNSAANSINGSDVRPSRNIKGQNLSRNVAVNEETFACIA